MTQFIRNSGLLVLAATLAVGCSGGDADGYHEVQSAEAVAVDGSPEASTDDTPSELESDVAAGVAGGSLSEAVPVDSGPDSTGAESGGDVVASAGSQEPVTTPKSPEAASTETAAGRTEAGPAETPGLADPTSPKDEKAVTAREIKLLIPEKDFREEGPEKAVRVSYDDFDLLKVLNMEPVTQDGLKLMPGWLKELDGRRIRVRGFMYPPFEESDLQGFVLARDNQICCFGRNPLVYDLVSVQMRDGVTTDYIQNRPFDVVGVFHIGDSVEPGDLYWMDDAVVIDR